MNKPELESSKRLQTIGLNLYSQLLSLISAQIIKCEALASVGVGPDALINARLVKEEIEVLLPLAEQFSKKISQNRLSMGFVLQVASQMKFYLDQEHLRAYAAHIVAPVPIHKQVNNRVNSMLDALNVVYALLMTPVPNPDPTNQHERRTVHYSASIALKILDMAWRGLKPSDKLSNTAQKQFKKFHDRHLLFKSDIEKLRQKSQQLKDTYQPKIPIQPLIADDAKQYCLMAKNQLKALQGGDIFTPTSKL